MPVGLPSTEEQAAVADSVAQLVEALLDPLQLLGEYPGLGSARVLAGHPVARALNASHGLRRLGGIPRELPVLPAQFGELVFQHGDALRVLDAPLGGEERLVVVVGELLVEPDELGLDLGQHREILLKGEALVVDGVQRCPRGEGLLGDQQHALTVPGQLRGGPRGDVRLPTAGRAPHQVQTRHEARRVGVVARRVEPSLGEPVGQRRVTHLPQTPREPGQDVRAGALTRPRSIALRRQRADVVQPQHAPRELRAHRHRRALPGTVRTGEADIVPRLNPTPSKVDQDVALAGPPQRTQHVPLLGPSRVFELGLDRAGGLLTPFGHATPFGPAE